MFRVKVCGVTSPADARMVVEAGGDAIGLNFYAGSRRCLTREQAEHIVETLPDEIVRVGLFVNATDDEVCRMYDHLQLDLIQLHGDEPPEFLLSLGQRPVLRAFRLGPQGLRPVAQYLDQCVTLACDLQAILIDAHEPGAYGGTGKTADWDLLTAERHLLRDLPLVLAGGLRPDNVVAAIKTVKPDAVDTCSGVERSGGCKDEGLVREFVAKARQSLAGALK